MKTILTALALTTAVIAAPANAALTINIDQTGSQVTATINGSISLSGLSGVGSFSNVSGISSNYVGAGVRGPLLGYAGFTGPSYWGDYGWSADGASTGDIFSMNTVDFGRPYIFVAPSYVSGANLSAVVRATVPTGADLKLAPGQYIYKSPFDTITVNVLASNSAVPEPATWLTMILGFGAIGYAMRRRQKVSFKVA